MPDPLRALAGLTAAVLTLGGCASIPTAGPVHRGGAARAGAQDPPIRVVPPPPRPGASEVDIVRGFLAADASFDEQHRVAKQYLSAAARSRWNPRSGTSVYQRIGPPQMAGGSVGRTELSVRYDLVAAVDADGRYTEQLTPQPRTAHFTLRREHGEWRIDQLPDGVLLARTDLTRAFRLLDVFFLDANLQTLVPEVLLLPVEPDLPDVLVRRVLRGPSERFVGAVVSPASRLRLRAPVRVDDGVALVDLTGAAVPGDAPVRQALAAQLVWTLRQLQPDVRAVRITVDGSPFDVPGSSGEVFATRDTWLSFDPDVLGEDATPYAVVGNRLGRPGPSFQPVRGPAGAGVAGLRQVAVSVDQRRVALVIDGTRLLTGPLEAAGALTPVLTGGDLVDPSFDRGGTLWVLDRRAGVLKAVSPEGKALRDVALSPAGGPVTALRVSRDGARVALITGSGAVARVQVGVLARRLAPGPPVIVLTGLRPIEVDEASGGYVDVGWVDHRRLVVLPAVAGPAPAPPVVTDVLGYASVLAPALTAPARAVTAGPSEQQPMIVATSQNQLLRLEGRGWTLLGAGRDPLYPG